jgi:hypothetical protein
VGDHAYRLVIECPTQRIGPPVARFAVSDTAPEAGTVYLRFDGPGRNLLSPADTPVINPADATIAVITLAGMTTTGAEDARSGCAASMVYDGLDPEILEPGSPFSP